MPTSEPLVCRYLEFNLLSDRGVRFGLPHSSPQPALADSGPAQPSPGYVQAMESIMVSAPPLVRWSYKALPEPGSPEEQLVRVLQQPRRWA
jgi:coproporphyrinogen III oxidase